MSTTTYDVAGMTCQHCVRAVTAEVGAVRGVQDVTVDLEGGAVTVIADGPVSLDSVRDAVVEAGYELVGVRA